MNYRHAFHAGDHADVLKHVVLAAMIERLKTKARPFRVLEKPFAATVPYGTPGGPCRD